MHRKGSQTSPQPIPYCAPLHIHEFSRRHRKLNQIRERERLGAEEGENLAKDSLNTPNKFFSGQCATTQTYKALEGANAALGIRKILGVEWDEIHEFRVKGVHAIQEEFDKATESMSEENRQKHLSNMRSPLQFHAPQPTAQILAHLHGRAEIWMQVRAVRGGSRGADRGE